MTAIEVKELKKALAMDAAVAAEFPASLAWLEPEEWKNYMASGVRSPLYRSFTDRELTAVLTEAANRLGHVPSKKEVFCVYRVFLIQRFGNWPKALIAAGLKLPKADRKAIRKRARREAEQRPRRMASIGGEGA